jgi:NAD:arginine ADP-ribosyltransferase
VREDLSALYPKGKEFAWWALSSCTASVSVLESPNYLGKTGDRTMFSIKTKSGKNIRAHSYFENEDEILLPPGIYLKVIDSVNPAEGLHIIHLQEIPPPHPLLAEPFDLSQMKQALPEIKPLPYTPYPSTNQEKYSTPIVPSKPPVQISSKQGELPLSY